MITVVVIAIIAILAAVLFPVFAQAREKARSVVCLSNTEQISLPMRAEEVALPMRASLPRDWYESHVAEYLSAEMARRVLSLLEGEVPHWQGVISELDLRIELLESAQQDWASGKNGVHHEWLRARLDRCEAELRKELQSTGRRYAMWRASEARRS